ncbi:hypothetical protein E1B28_012484 [Marasmius oreades]|uniref:Uncharacterized protein n=1 Tax=Marasmius oreades TaxID=181124 RepID=A0A9P7RRK2_9AGAR|nr:uncharacterized protein E1B28_012484 [Marasmius oreades]KAG7088496.1 hypothetical protein E1B28_012484 [Marasmius oreades]
MYPRSKRRYPAPKDGARWNNYSRPPPSHRHSGPSAPWPWINIDDEIDAKLLASDQPPIPEMCDHSTCNGCWEGYPKSRFPNWTDSQVRRSGIKRAIQNYDKKNPCLVYYMDMINTGLFQNGGTLLVYDDETYDHFWNRLVSIQRPVETRLRAIFVKNMSGPILQMLGAKYNIEPFFFSSSLSWIPSRFQEEVRPGKGDHITITLTFLRAVEGNLSSTVSHISEDTAVDDEVLDTQRPLYLGSGDGCYLVLDLLAVHLIRDEHSSTVISYHHTDPDTTAAEYLHERIRYAGKSVYWQNIFRNSPDPTFIVLLFLWHAMYAWDEALEVLYRHIIDMEKTVMDSADMYMTRGLHFIRAHHLHYASLLQDMKKSVRFVLTTPNPAMENVAEDVKLFSEKLLEKECNNLLIEIERLEMQLNMQDQRLKNVMNLVFSTVNIQDSSRMQELSEAAVRDSAAMKQIAYLTMIFLPASYTASVFGMNVKELTVGAASGVLVYIAVALPLTFVTVWVIMTFQSKHFFPNRSGTTFWMRLAWPLLFFRSMFGLDPKSKDERLTILNGRREAAHAYNHV